MFNKQQQLAYIGRCTEGEDLNWLNVNKDRYNDLEEVKDTIRKYNSNHYKPNRAFNEMRNLRETSIVQQYLNNIERRNVYAKITDHYLINIILKGITLCLCPAITSYKVLRSVLFK